MPRQPLPRADRALERAAAREDPCSRRRLWISWPSRPRKMWSILVESGRWSGRLRLAMAKESQGARVSEDARREPGIGWLSEPQYRLFEISRRPDMQTSGVICGPI